MTGKKSLAIALMTASMLCALAVVPCFAQNDVSLGEVARKHRAERAKARHSTITEENLVRKPMSKAEVTNSITPGEYGSSASIGSSASNAPEVSSGETKAEAQPAEASKAEGEQSATKKDQGTKQDRVAALKKNQEELKGIVEQMKSRLDTETQENRRQVWRETMEHAQQVMEQNERELKDAEKSGPPK